MGLAIHKKRHQSVHRGIFEQNEIETIWCEIFDVGEGTLIGVSYRSCVAEDEALFKIIENVR